MENLLKSKTTINELLNATNIFVEQNIINSFEVNKIYKGNFESSSEDVLLFWFGSCGNDLSFMQSLISSYSAISSGNKIHLFSTADNKYNAAMIKFLENANLDNLSSLLKFTLIDTDDFENLKAYKRAKRFGSKSYFPHFNFWCVKNLDYARINIFHNDTVFNGKIDYTEEDEIVCYISTYSRRRHNKRRMMRVIKSKFPSIDKELFFNKHIHTGVGSVNKEVRDSWKKFIIENVDWINENWNIFMYHEQEILAIVKQLGNFELTHSNENKVWKFSNETFLLHYDENYKDTLYMDDDLFSRKTPHNFKDRSWNFESINLIRKNINDVWDVISKN